MGRLMCPQCKTAHKENEQLREAVALLKREIKRLSDLLQNVANTTDDAHGQAEAAMLAGGLGHTAYGECKGKSALAAQVLGIIGLAPSAPSVSRVPGFRGFRK